MVSILKIAFLVCLTFIFLAPNGVRALVCVHCVSKDLNGTDAEECIGKENSKYAGADCGPGNTKICKMMDITSNGKKDVVRGCVSKPEEFNISCCAERIDPANPESMLPAPVPYWACFCDKDNCNNMFGVANKDNLPAGFIECPLSFKGILIVGPTGPPQQLSLGNDTSSQDHPRGSSLSVLGVVCLTVLLVIPALVNHNNLQY